MSIHYCYDPYTLILLYKAYCYRHMNHILTIGNNMSSIICIVYYWKCTKDNCKDFPKCEYIGLSSRPYRNRLAEHKQYIRSKNVDKSSGYHFNKSGHNLSHLAGLVLEHVKSDDAFVLRAREYLYIQKFDCYRNGLNMEP